MAKIDGRGRMRQVLKSLPQSVRAQIRAEVLGGAESIAQVQRKLVPVKTGKLRDSIVVTPADQDPPAYAALKSKKNNFPDPELAAIVSAGNKDARHAGLVEHGTSPHVNAGEFPGTQNPGSPAQPFFFPGFRAMVKAVKRRINKAARKGIKDGLK